VGYQRKQTQNQVVETSCWFESGQGHEIAWPRSSMTRDQVKEILDRVLTWPAKRQEDAARVLSEMEAQDTTGHHLCRTSK
jgi:hypothetical protein